MAGGGGGAKKLFISLLLDHPVKTYLAVGGVLYLHRQYQIRTTYNYHFGKFDFQRRLERGQLGQ